MFRNSLLAQVVLCSLVAAACSIDSRKLSNDTLGARPTPDASTPVLPDGGGSMSSPAGSPELSVEPTSVDLGPAVRGVPSRVRLAVGNAGSGLLAAPSVAFEPGSAPDYVILHNQCENALASGERCDVRVQLLASLAGPLSASVDVSSSGQSLAVALTATGVEKGPLIVAAAPGSSGDFGGVLLGNRLEASFDVSNPGDASSGPLQLVLNDAAFALVPPAPGECVPGTTQLKLGESCRARVAFAPAQRGPVDAALTVTSSLGGSALRLAGSGRAAASLVAPERVDFGSVVLATQSKRTVFLQNQGDEPLELSALALTDPAAVTGTAGSAFSVDSGDCGAGQLLAGGDACSLTLAFRPQAASAEQQAQLVATGSGGIQSTVVLSGNGLSAGALTLEPAANASGDFGDLLVGAPSTQRFTVTNPSAQPSGPLELHTYDDFVLEPPAAAEDCESGVTSLVGGQSCSVAVTLTPSRRGQHDGALFVGSSLAGNANLALTGRGLSPARLALARGELDFGRVPTETPVQQSVTLQNAGDQALAGLQAVLEAASGDGAAFRLDNPCTADLAPGASCVLSVSFVPAAAIDYASVLRLTSATGAAASTLLVGSAFPRGSLVLAAVDGTGDFGDTALGSPRTIQFTITNPGDVPSGRLTITSSNNLFTLDPGDCSPAGGTGLASGASCTFSVTFAPASSELVAANLSVQSPGAGETAFSVSGRGRVPAVLSADGNRDFGVANVGQAGLTEPANSYTWTLLNEGDLDTGTLQVANSNAAEFTLQSDTCSNAIVPGHGSCAIEIRFRPSAAGARSAELVVVDAGSGQELPLSVTGTGLVIAQPGQSCANGATCASGECTGGVCCDRDCAGSCQACSATGVCQDQAERQACGNGSGQCFGVDRCLLPEGQRCSGDEQCGDGNCERRLGGTGANDRVCCLEDCSGTGTLCNPDTGRCEVPALPEGAACGAAGQAACGGGLQCKACLGGGRACTPTSDCCGGCGAGYTCSGGTCGCPIGANGRAQIDCGNGSCIQDRQNACCVGAPQCPTNLQFCDSGAGLCRECLTAAQCPPRGTNSVASCTNFTCSYSCAPSTRDCGGGNCVPEGQCCSDADCGACGQCVNGFCSSRCGPNEICEPVQNRCEEQPTNPGDPSATCATQTFGVGRDCGWSFVPNGLGIGCVPGTAISFLCACDTTCTGDPMLRLCTGTQPCTSAAALAQNDDSCGRCPQVDATCPADGVVSLMFGPFGSGDAFSCSVF